MAEAATSAGLDFIVSTDHNTNSANRAWASNTAETSRSSQIGEVTTRHGHWLAIGLPPGGWVDWRYAPRDGAFAGYADRYVQMAAWWWPPTRRSRYPAAPGSSVTRDVDAIEVWNGLWNVDDELSLRIWHQLLRQGRRITAVGGSDSHVAGQPVGRPQTVVDAEELWARSA